MENNQGYVIRQSVLFDNGRGFAMGENFKAPNPFVTWQFTQEGGKRDYYWGHYFNEECEAIGDYNRRVFSYEKQYGVSRLETSGPDFFKYYSTQRPVDIATYPRPKDNLPVAHLNYNTRQPVEGESFRAWGELWYLHPLTEKQMADYELRPAHDNPEGREPVPERGAAKKPPIAEQMKEGPGTQGTRGNAGPPGCAGKEKSQAGTIDRRSVLWRKSENRSLPTRRPCDFTGNFMLRSPQAPGSGRSL